MSKTKHRTMTKQKSSYGIWLIALTIVFVSLAIIGTLTSGGGPRDGHAPVIDPSGRSDASHVLAPTHFRDSRQQHAYAVAHQIPEVPNQLYCWCGCKENPQTRHRALLECFESDHA